MGLRCKDWGDLSKAKVLLIGHDPRLQESDTIAEYCFFADYYFKQVSKIQDRRKQGLAKSAFNLVMDLTNGKFSVGEIYITNLCNDELPRTNEGETVYIPQEKAEEGIQRINNILSNSNIEYVFATSLQVNYWLQKLGLYSSDNEFLYETHPRKSGLINEGAYFKPKKPKSFKKICGNIYDINNHDAKLIPVLHPKLYPLNARMREHYYEHYESIKRFFNDI